MINVEHISKNYGEKNEKVLAVDDVSFSVNDGEIFGLIGQMEPEKLQFLEF